MYTLPFLTVLVALMLIRKSTQKSYCIIAGIVCTLACSIYAGKITLLQSTVTLFQISKDVLLGNATLFGTLLLFGILIQLITDSGAIKKLTSILNEYLCSKWHFLCFLVLCALVASVDDYLACILLITLFSTCYKSFNLSKAEICFYINTIVVAFCSSLPISTWAPIIDESLKSETALKSFSFLRYCFNYFTYFSVFVVFMAFLLKKVPLKKCYNLTIHRHININFESKILLVAVSILYVTYVIFSKFSIPFLSNNSLLSSCILTLLFCQINFLKHGNIKYSDLKSIYVNGVKSMWNLVKFLCLLWIYTDCLEQILGINEIIFNQVSRLAIPYNILPFVIYLFSGFISYCTGSVFATIRLLVPLSITLGTTLELNTATLWLITSAALNGSLLASVSPLSDTIAICCEEIGLSTKKAYHSHAPYSIMIITTSGIAYLISGYTLCFNLIFSIVIPILVLCPLMALCIECIDELRLMHSFKHMLYNHQICPFDVSFKHKWRFVKHIKKLLFIYKKYTTKPKHIQLFYRLKLC